MKCTGASGVIPCACRSTIMSSTTPRETAEISGIVTPSWEDMTKTVGGTVLRVTAMRDELGSGWQGMQCAERCARVCWLATGGRDSFAMPSHHAAIVRHEIAFRLLLSFAIAAALSLAAVAARAQSVPTGTLGIFRGQGDVGQPSVPGAGALRYDPRKKTYDVTGGGANMWATSDH